MPCLPGETKLRDVWNLQKWSLLQNWPQARPYDPHTDICERLRTVAGGWTQPQPPDPPEWNGNPCYAFGKNPQGNEISFHLRLYCLWWEQKLPLDRKSTVDILGFTKQSLFAFGALKVDSSHVATAWSALQNAGLSFHSRFPKWVPLSAQIVWRWNHGTLTLVTQRMTAVYHNVGQNFTEHHMHRFYSMLLYFLWCKPIRYHEIHRFFLQGLAGSQKLRDPSDKTRILPAKDLSASNENTKPDGLAENYNPQTANPQRIPKITSLGSPARLAGMITFFPVGFWSPCWFGCVYTLTHWTWTSNEMQPVSASEYYAIFLSAQWRSAIKYIYIYSVYIYM